MCILQLRFAHMAPDIDTVARLKNVLRSISRFDEDTLIRVCESFKQVSAGRNTILLAEGETCRHFYFVFKGCIRTFFIDRQGHEKTRYVMTDNFVGTALASFINQKPSFESLDALEDSTLLAISHNAFYKLADEEPQWNDCYRTMLEMAYTFQNNRLESLVTLSAKERYEQVMKHNPLIVQRLSNKVLASYLDIREETLSRIKSA